MATYKGKKVSLNKPRASKNKGKKFEVFVKSGDKVKKVTFGDPNMKIRKTNKEAKKSFCARHKCNTATDKTKARYWSCKKWGC